MTDEHIQQVIADLQKANERQEKELFTLANRVAEQDKLIVSLYERIGKCLTIIAERNATIVQLKRLTATVEVNSLPEANQVVDWKEGLGL